jgi:hypothetical protein
MNSMALVIFHQRSSNDSLLSDLSLKQLLEKKIRYDYYVEIISRPFFFHLNKCIFCFEKRNVDLHKNIILDL